MIATLLALTALAAPPAAAPVYAPKNRPYDVQKYRLELTVDEAQGTFKTKETITAKATKGLPSIELDAYDLTIEAASVNGEAVTPKLVADPLARTGTLTLAPKAAVAANKDFTVELTFTGKASAAHEGFFQVPSDDPKAPPYFFTHFQAAFAQRFFACNDEPADKASFELSAVVNQAYAVLSNGAKGKDEAYAEGGKNLRRVEWAQEDPISTYLFAVAVGKFEPVVASDDPSATVWVLPGAKERAFVIQDALKEVLRTEAGFVGVKYPWKKADVVAVPRFIWSGMENASLIFERESGVVLDHKNDQNSRSYIVGLLAHELAHQWFGNDVTCAWWNEAWLNEGFAEYLGMKAFDSYNDNEEAEILTTRWLVEGYFRQEAGPRARALASKVASAADAFDDTSYTKGAAVLRMLETWLGKNELKKVLKAYLEKFAFKAVTSDDFFKVLFETTKKDKELKPFKESWLVKKGYPVISPSFTYGGGKMTVTIRQQPNRGDEKGPFVFKLPIVLHRANEPAYTKEELILVDKPEVKVDLDVPALPDWVNWNKDFGALVRVNPSVVNEDAWCQAARSDPDPTWRLIAAWNLLGELGNPDATTEALPSDAALNAVIDVLDKDPSPFVREAVVRRLANSRFKKLPPALTKSLLALAKRPSDMNEDPQGYIRVRSIAMEALARCDSPDGHSWLRDEASKRELDLNYVGGFTAAVARLNTPAGLAALRTSLVNQKSRGYGYWRRAAEALGSVPSADAVPLLKDALKGQGLSYELLRAIAGRMTENRPLKDSKELAALVQEWALDEAIGTEMRANLLAILDDVKTDAAKAALTAIAEQAKSDRLKHDAKLLLDANFPAPKAAEPAKDASKGKKK